MNLEPPRTTAATVFGILNIIFASLGFLAFASAVVSLLVDFNQLFNVPPPPPGSLQARQLAISKDPQFLNLNLMLQCFKFLLAVELLFSGIYLLKKQLLGRTLALCFVLGQALFVLISLIFYYLWVAKPLLELLPLATNPAESLAMRMQAYLPLIMWPITGLTYELIMLCFMLRPSFKRALEAAEAAAKAPPEEAAEEGLPVE